MWAEGTSLNNTSTQAWTRGLARFGTGAAYGAGGLSWAGGVGNASRSLYTYGTVTQPVIGMGARFAASPLGTGIAGAGIMYYNSDGDWSATAAGGAGGFMLHPSSLQSLSEAIRGREFPWGVGPGRIAPFGNRTGNHTEDGRITTDVGLIRLVDRSVQIKV